MVGCMAKKKTSEAIDEVEAETAEEANVEEEGTQMQVDPESIIKSVGVWNSGES